MDLETVGKQMLEALALQGQIAVLETKLAEFPERIARADEAVQDSEDEKTTLILAKVQAQEVLSKAYDGETEARESLARAKAYLKSTESVVREAEVEVTKYSDELFDHADAVISENEAVKVSIEEHRDAVAAEIDSARKDLEVRQAELKAQGVELTLGQMRQPRTINL